MKRTQLLLIMLLTLASSVWAADIATLSFYYTRTGGGNLYEGSWDGDKCILNSDFEYSKGKDDVCNRSNGGEIDNYVMFKNGGKAHSRQTYNFPGGNVKLTLDCKCKDHNTYTGPTVTIDGKVANFGSISFGSDYEQKNVEVTISGVSAGEHYIDLNFSNSDKFYVKTLKLSYEASTTYALTLSSDANGEAHSNQGHNAAIPENASVTITATPNTGYKFVNWTGTSTETSNPFNFTMNADKNYRANFAAAAQYTISVNAGANGSASGSGMYYEGSQQTITATPNTGYEFSQWNDGNKENPRTITVTGNATYTASFAKVNPCTNTLTIQCEENRIEPTNTTKPYNLQTITSDHHYAGWTGTGYLDFKGSDGDICYAVHLPAATYTINIHCTNGYNRWFNIFKKGHSTRPEDQITYNGDSYGKFSYHGLDGGNDSPFSTKSVNAGYLSEEDYILVLYGQGWCAFDCIEIVANSKVFCPPASTYTITYDHGTNGTGSIAAGEKTEGEGFTLSDETFSRNGYVQTGWATTDGGDKAYDLGGTYTEDADLTLYPVWEEDLTTVWYMKGTFVDDWGTRYDFVKAAGHSTESVASITLEGLAKNQDYWFKLWDDRNDYGQTGSSAKMTWDNNSWTLNGSNNVGMQTTAAGNYTFTVNFSGASPVLTISYPNCYTITYYKNDEGATGTMAAEGYIEEGGNRTIPAVGFSKAHWHFLGWATSADGEVVYADAATIENIREDINLYAKWAIDRFDVVYDGNGVDGYKGELPTTVTYDYDTEVTISDVVLEKFGYTFVGWNSNSEASIAESGTFHIDANKTFYAIWQVTKPTMVTIEPENKQWNVDKGTSVQMIATLTPDANTMAIENRELTWSSSDATRAFVNQEGYVSFVGTGSATITATSKVDGSVHGAYNFTINAGSCSGWEISSYHEDKSNQKYDYFKQVGSSNEWRCAYVLPNSSDKFWIGNCDGWWDKKYGGHSEEWTFDWLRLADRRDNNYYPGQDAVGELVIWDNSSDNNWYVAFLPNYRMSYMLNGSEWRIMNFHHTQGYEYETDIFRVPAGYKDNAGMKCYVGIQKANGDNMEVRGKSSQVSMNTIGGLSDSNMAGKYGKWHIYSNYSDQNWYCQFIYYNNVTFEMNGGAGNIDPIYGKNGANETFNTGTLYDNEHAPTRTGYTLTGWKDQNDVIYGLNQDVTINSDLVLTAQWAPATYTITLNKNNGAADGQATATYDNNALTSVTHVARTGYDLTGYFTEAAAGSMVITSEGALVTSVANYTDESGRWIKPADATLYAQWQAKQYTVTLNNQGATTAGQANVTATYDAAMPSIAGNLPANTGYTFGGYYDAENGAGTQYYTNAGASAHAWDKAAPTTLYAKWTADTYTITYTLNGGVNSGSNPDSYTIESATFALLAPTRDNYTFAGWYTEAGFVSPISSIVQGSTGNLHLYAKWTPTPFNITYYLDGGTNHGSNPTTYTVESAAITLQDPTKDGYDFVGWYADSEFRTESHTIAARSTGAKTFYAKWAERIADNLIVTGHSNTHTHDGAYDGNGGNLSISNVADPTGLITHNVLKFDYSMPFDGSYYGEYIARDDEFNQSNSAGATGFGFYYCTDRADESIAFCLQDQTDQHKFELPGTGGVWKYKYFATEHAASFNSGGLIIYINGLDGSADTKYTSGTFYISEIRATKITSKPDLVPMRTVTFTQPANGSVSASIVGGAAIESGEQVEKGTRVVFTCTPDDGYDFVKYNDGTNDIAENPYTVTINSDLTITTTIEQAVVKHNLTASAAEHGSVSPTAQEVGEGREATVTATPDANYRFDHWTAVGYDLTGHVSDNPLTVTMPTNDVALTAYFVFDEVHNMIATGADNAIATGYNSGATMSYDNVSDQEFDHNVMKFTYSGMTGGAYYGSNINKDGGYTVNAKATGFAFWYKTEPGVNSLAFCLDYGSQVKTQLPGTNGTWKYAYVAADAAATWNGSQIIVYINATDAATGSWANGLKTDGTTTTSPANGVFYLSEIQATNVTSMPDKVTPTYTITLNANGGLANGSATATLNSSTLTGVTHVARTGHILQGYFTASTEGTKVINADGSLVAGVAGYTDGSANWTKEDDATLYAQWQAKVTHVTANANGGAYAGDAPCNGDFPYGYSATVECFPTKTDYNFLGYTLTQDGDDYIFNADGDMVDRAGYVADGHWVFEGENLTIYAKWISATTYYDISVAATPAEKGTVTMKVGEAAPTSETQHVLAGTEITLTATCTADGYAFKQWQDGNRQNPRIIEATETTTYTATFETYYTVTATMGEPGDRIEGADQPHFGGDQVTLTAVARTRDSGGNDYELTYGFKNWTNISGVSLTDEQKMQNPLTFSMPYQGVSLKANFSPIECTSTKTIQCEDNGTYIPFNSTHIDATNKNRIPHVGDCGPFNDYYTDYHGTGYYDYKAAADCEMFYPVTLPAGTYQFVVWAASNGDKNCWMNLYTLDGTQSGSVTYYDVTYTKRTNVSANNNCGEGGAFQAAATISDVELATRQTVIIGLYAQYSHASFDQIVITETNGTAVFCEPLSTEQFTIEAGQKKEVPVCGVANLTIYEGGEATNYDDFEVTQSVKYIDTVADTDMDKWLTLCTPYQTNAITVVNDPDAANSSIWPLWMNQHSQLKAGYFYIKQLGDHDETAFGEEFKQRWEVIKTQYPQDDMAYIVKYPSETYDSYFIDKLVSYNRTGAATIYGIKNATEALAAERIVSEPRFYYYPNHSMSTLHYDGAVYMLNDEGTNFDLQINPDIKPFTCYIQATEEYKAKHRSLRMTDVLEAEQGGTITTGMEHTDWTIDLLLRDPATRIYDMLGRSMNNIRQLPTGVYTLVNGDYSVKYVVK